MAKTPRQLPRISTSAARRVSSFAMVAVCLMGTVWSGSAIAVEQGLKIRILNAEEAPGDPSIEKIDTSVLTPPAEGKVEPLPSPPALEVEPQSDMPGYLTDPGSGVLNESLSDQQPLPYHEPSLSSYAEQRQFQHGLRGIREYLLTGSDDEATLLQPEASDEPSPELVWRFAPFQRLRFLGGRLRGLGLRRHSQSHEAFAKLFPWNRTPGRNQGVGEPLVNDSWRWAPFGAGWFMGYMEGTTLVTDWTGAKGGIFNGYHLSWDFDHYWGTEFRYGFASLAQWDNMPLYDSETHGMPSTQMLRRHATLKYGDLSFLYYPWGDARWRPYAKWGLGWGYIKFTDLNHHLWANTTMTMPMGIGLKYRHSRRLVFRMEMMDNFLFGERGINPQHNLSLTAGVEFRFGGTRKAYWPYNPGLHYW